MAWFDVLMALAFWALCFSLHRGSKSLRRVLQDPRVIGARMFALCIALSLSFQIDPFAGMLDRALGINNLSWLVGYVLAVCAVYAGIFSVTAVDARTPPRWLTVLTLAVIGGFLVLTPGLTRAAEELHDALPKSTPTLLLRELLYVYLLSISALGFTNFARWQLHEKLPSGKLRNWLMMYGFAAGFGFCVLRGAASVMLYADPQWTEFDLATTVSSALLFSCMAALTFGLAPVSWLRVPVRAILYAKQRIALHRLEQLRGHLAPYTGVLPWTQPTNRERWFNVPYALYCTLIDILDRRTLLLARLNREGVMAEPHQRELAMALQSLPDTENWIELVRHFQDVARKLERG